MPQDKTPLPAEDLQKFLTAHAGWSVGEGGRLQRTLEFPAFLTGITFVQQLAAIAEKQDHHPDLDIRWRKITVRLFTDDAKALTWRDVKLASEAELLAKQLSAH